MAKDFLTLMGASSPYDPSHRYVTSWLLPPSAIFAVRLIICVYGFTAIFVRWGLVPSNVGPSFSYFTNLTYWGIAFYMLFTSFHGFCYMRKGDALLNRWPRFLQMLHTLLYTTVTVFPFIVTIVYWAVLFSGKFENRYDAWNNITVHALNSVTALFEIIVPRTDSHPWLHIPFLIVMLAGYLGVAYITADTEGFYAYSFLDPAESSRGKTAAYVVGVLIAAIVLFLLSKGLIEGRKWVTEKKMGMRGKFSKKDGGRGEKVGETA